MTCAIAPIQGKKPMCTPPSLIRKNRSAEAYHNILAAYGSGVPQVKESYSKANQYYSKFGDSNFKLNIQEPYCPLMDFNIACPKKEPYSTAMSYYDKFADANYNLNKMEPFSFTQNY
jgi:hypothetical protein